MSSLKLVLLSCISALVCAQNSTSHNSTLSSDTFKINRVIGGTAASKGEFPHQVSLQIGSLPYVPFHHICGGSIIHERWILTAAHCVNDLPKNLQLIVKAGMNLVKTQETTEQTAFVGKIFTHKEYRGSVSPFDIALIKLMAPLKFDKFVNYISLPESNSLPRGKLVLSGWGSTSKSELPILPNELQKVTLSLVDINTCRHAMQTLQQLSEIHETNLCTGPLTGQFSACNGDSGGPLIEVKKGGNRLVGVVSWGVYPCAAVGAPAIFVRVSAFIDWIHTTMKNN